MNPAGEAVVIIGGGFGGLEAAKTLGRAGARVTLIDRLNYHLFQPLLYQVATGGLSPGDISSPLRAVLKRHRNTTVLMAEVVDIFPGERRVVLRDGSERYDHLIVATGTRHSYFGHKDWEREALGLKTIEDAIEIRRRILRAFEAAERAESPRAREIEMTFVVIGGGPTGVELAGALGELARQTLRRDFRRIDPTQTRIYLLEGSPRLLPTYPESLSHCAERSLERLGVTVRTGAMVTRVEPTGVAYTADGQEQRIEARTILWAAGVQASPLGRVLHERTGAEIDKAGRVKVAADLTVPGHPEISVIGDLAVVEGADGRSLPGVAPVAMQQGRYAARRILGTIPPGVPFRYRDKGALAVIGRNAAVAAFGRVRFSGAFAWFVWVFVHIRYLIEFDHRFLVLSQWAINYFTRKRGARLITYEPKPPPAEDEE